MIFNMIKNLSNGKIKHLITGIYKMMKKKLQAN